MQSCFCQRDATLRGWNPSTSFSLAIAAITLSSLMCLGRGSCTRIPSTVSSALSSSIMPRSSASEIVSGLRMVVFLIPTYSDAFALPVTYDTLPGSSPTRITTRWGTRPYFSGKEATCSFISSFSRAERSFPDITFAIIIPSSRCRGDRTGFHTLWIQQLQEPCHELPEDRLRIPQP